MKFLFNVICASATNEFEKIDIIWNRVTASPKWQKSYKKKKKIEKEIWDIMWFGRIYR